MIFTCGVRFMRAKSAGVSGRLSGSLAAAASISPYVIIRRGRLEHDPEKCAAVFGKDHAPLRT
jgi:hypothetical protein